MSFLENRLKIPISPQCQFFVQRKKRLCRMTVRPGNQFCGEHSPAPNGDEVEADSRVPCPLDPKHTCFRSKLEKHIKICNARQTEQPLYICKNINVVMDEDLPRVPLHTVPRDTLAEVVDKINQLYDCYLTDVVEACVDQDIHPTVLAEYSEPDRTDTSRRQIKQVSSLLRLLEREGLVDKELCYVDLGAGRGRLSLYVRAATGARVLAVERASVRHRRDTAAGTTRLKADLAHLRLDLCLEPHVRCLGIAKHLCGDATDLAIRAMSRSGARGWTRGLVLATCCHHRCRPRGYVAAGLLEKLGITEEDLSIILGIVSWATCGDGYSRELRHKLNAGNTHDEHDTFIAGNTTIRDSNTTISNSTTIITDSNTAINASNTIISDSNTTISDSSTIITDSNTAINDSNTIISDSNTTISDGNTAINDSNTIISDSNTTISDSNTIISDSNTTISDSNTIINDSNTAISNTNTTYKDSNATGNTEPSIEQNENVVKLNRKQREEVGRRAKLLLDWGRVMYLRDCGFDARLVYFVTPDVTLENVCIVAK